MPTTPLTGHGSSARQPFPNHLGTLTKRHRPGPPAGSLPPLWKGERVIQAPNLVPIAVTSFKMRGDAGAPLHPALRVTSVARRPRGASREQSGGRSKWRQRAPYGPTTSSSFCTWRFSESAENFPDCSGTPCGADVSRSRGPLVPSGCTATLLHHRPSRKGHRDQVNATTLRRSSAEARRLCISVSHSRFESSATVTVSGDRVPRRLTHRSPTRCRRCQGCPPRFAPKSLLYPLSLLRLRCGAIVRNSEAAPMKGVVAEE